MSRQRLDVTAAAQLLGISSDAVRKRAERGRIESERDADGKLYIMLDTDTPEADRRDDRDQLVEFLRSELAAWQEEARRKDHIIAALTERIPELEAASEARGTPVSSSEEQERGTGSAEPEMVTERPSWWRRWFGA
jgi:hypothetical protein